ncbi:hypothetical protein ES702_06407 [subsurface metagenome]
MKWRYFFKALTIVGIVADWSTKALVDGKITAKEATDLGVQVANALGIKTEIELPK